jgi:hypothetical protein
MLPSVEGMVVIAVPVTRIRAVIFIILADPVHRVRLEMQHLQHREQVVHMDFGPILMLIFMELLVVAVAVAVV